MCCCECHNIAQFFNRKNSVFVIFSDVTMSSHTVKFATVMRECRTLKQAMQYESCLVRLTALIENLNTEKANLSGGKLISQYVNNAYVAELIVLIVERL